MLVWLRATERVESDDGRHENEQAEHTIVETKKGCSKADSGSRFTTGLSFALPGGVYNTLFCCGLDDFLFITICGFGSVS